MAAKNSSLLRWSNILAFILTVIVNGLAGSTTILGGKVTADISNANPTLITPAGYVFAIWGVIYVLLGAFVVYHLNSALFNNKVGFDRHRDAHLLQYRSLPFRDLAELQGRTYLDDPQLRHLEDYVLER